MIAFIPDASKYGYTSSNSYACTIIYMGWNAWGGMYIEKTAAGIMVLLTILISLNTFAIYLKKFEVKW